MVKGSQVAGSRHLLCIQKVPNPITEFNLKGSVKISLPDILERCERSAETMLVDMNQGIDLVG